VYADAEGRATSIDIAYNPATNRWRRLPSSPYPVVPIEGGFHALWTGSEMLAFGSMDAAYSPATNTWRPLPPGPAGASAVVWTGHQVIMWGGGCCSRNTADGSAFDVARGVWEPIPKGPLSPRHAPGVWTGTEMIVVGGADLASDFSDGAAYNPATRTWRELPPMPAAVVDESITWTGTDVLLVGGTRSVGETITVSAAALSYNPSTNSWRRLPDMPLPRYQHLAAWTGDQLLVWGGVSASSTAPPYGAAYDPATNRWSPMPPSPLKARTDAVSAWTGAELVVWGGLGVATTTMLDDGAAFRPTRQARG
jgi:N-acetylneuraminic acid mutarotase